MYKETSSFFQSKAIALTGFSRNPKSFSRLIYNALTDRNFVVYPVNPNFNGDDSIRVYPSLSQVPVDVDAVYILNHKKTSFQIAREAASLGIRKIWIHTKCNSAEAREIEKKYGISMIMGECFFMWAEPVKGVHRFHRFIRTLFGGHREHHHQAH